MVKWIIEHTNTKDRSFNSSTGSQLTNFRPEIFTRAYCLKPAKQLLDADFVKASEPGYNFDEMLKSWMSDPGRFSQRKDDLYPIEWFREPYSFLVVMLYRIYGLPNCSFFKAEWAPIAHHVLTIG